MVCVVAACADAAGLACATLLTLVVLALVALTCAETDCCANDGALTAKTARMPAVPAQNPAERINASESSCLLEISAHP
jgi:hypothetical protein